MFKKLIFILLLCSLSITAASQCNQHVFSSVNATEWTSFEYQDCDDIIHSFGLPTGGYTTILCADIGTAFVLSGDGFVYPLLTEHPAYASCIQPPCLGDFDEDGVVGVTDLQTFLANYGACN